MTALEYFEQQRDRHQRNYNRAVLKGAAEEELQNISRKIGYYSQAVVALGGKEKKNERIFSINQRDKQRTHSKAENRTKGHNRSSET